MFMFISASMQCHVRVYLCMTAHVSIQAVDVSKERIYLDVKESSMTADDLPDVVPDGCPRYHFFLFKHTFEGDYQESVGMLHGTVLPCTFVYTMRIDLFIRLRCFGLPWFV